MFDKYPLYEMELKSYHESKRKLDSHETFQAYFDNTRLLEKNMIRFLYVENRSQILAAIELLSVGFQNNSILNSKFDFVFIYRGAQCTI